MFELNDFKELISQQTWFKWVIVIERFNSTIQDNIHDQNNDRSQQWTIVCSVQKLMYYYFNQKLTTVVIDRIDIYTYNHNISTSDVFIY